ncbi:MAG TPA: glycosyltransferase [Solirubrobacteraceae bacterium]|jgi:UDP:flavonoid glycosyltransferase YjiC (YdhE family)|nr:glycosyltransferase [Solirubrobacteraceae bacterium]
MRIFQTLLAFSGNAPPQLALMRRLVERGHQVRVLAHRAAGERVRATGAELVEFRGALPDMDMARPESDPLRDWEARTKLGAALKARDNLLVGLLADTSHECAQVLASWRADVVVVDWMLPGAMVAAEGAGVPAVALVHCPYPLPAAGVPPLGSGMKPMRGRLGAVRDGVAQSIARRMLGAGLPTLNAARAEQGLAPLADWDQQLLGVAEIHVLSAPELDFAGRAELPANVHYVGPAFEPYEGEWRSPWPAQAAGCGEDPLVVIGFSTSYMNQRAPVQRVLDAVADLPVRALLTAGPALEGAALRLPANARAVAYVPHRQVLPHAALMITHAGWQTINAALADGVPLVCLPGGRDQPDNAIRVVAAGAGVRVRSGASVRKLRGAIAAALADPALKQGAGALARALAHSDGAHAAAERIERLGERALVRPRRA